MSERPTFTDRRPFVVRELPNPVPVCDHCGAEGQPLWLNVTSYDDDKQNIERWYPVDWTCPNGPHPKVEL